MIAFLEYGGRRLVLEITPLLGEPGYGKAAVLYEKDRDTSEKAVPEFRGLNIGATRGARNSSAVADLGYRIFTHPLVPAPKIQKFLPVKITPDHTKFAEDFESFMRTRGVTLDRDTSLYPLNKNYRAFAKSQNLREFGKMSHYIVGAVGHGTLWEMLQEEGDGTRNPYFLRMPT